MLRLGGRRLLGKSSRWVSANYKLPRLLGAPFTEVLSYKTRVPKRMFLFWYYHPTGRSMQAADSE